MPRDVYGRPPRPLPPEEAGITRRSLLRVPLTQTARSEIDYEAITDRVRASWQGMDSDMALRAIEPVADVIAGLADVSEGAKVLDVGAGDGNVALSCARRGADVTACELAPAMLERARRRGGDGVSWVLADAQSLPFPDHHFDAVLSGFGAALAPRAVLAARELCRVVRPGGVVALAAWIPRGLPGGLHELAERLAPLPDGVPSPAAWGRHEVARRRLGPLLSGLELRTRSVRLRFTDPDAAFDALSAWTTLEPAQLSALRPDFDRLLSSCNNSVEGVEIDARYLVALGRRPTQLG
jgi:SAM-dependent methyltransferase